MELLAALRIQMPRPPRQFNVAPTQWAPVITASEPDQIQLFRWGMIPSWAKDESIGTNMINARSETILEKPVYRSALQRRRCLVLADGFYEWKRAGKKAQPFRLTLSDSAPFAFAGLWDHWQRPDGTEMWSYTIITTTPNAIAAEIHNRMPVILDRPSALRWLDAEQTSENLSEILKPFPAEKMRAYLVNPIVNRAGVEDPACIEEYREAPPAQQQLSLF
jgi:putative SOS response-associated peptidase YedK